MPFLKKLFAKKEEPECTVTIEGAGSLDWAAKSECWVGAHRGTTIRVAYDGLQAKDVVFQDPNFILIQFLGPVDHEPFWFAEIHGSQIYVGCDT